MDDIIYKDTEKKKMSLNKFCVLSFMFLLVLTIIADIFNLIDIRENFFYSYYLFDAIGIDVIVIRSAIKEKSVVKTIFGAILAIILLYILIGTVIYHY